MPNWRRTSVDRRHLPLEGDGKSNKQPNSEDRWVEKDIAGNRMKNGNVQLPAVFETIMEREATDPTRIFAGV